MQGGFSFQYDMPLFRPPSEANSLILQITMGCSYNKCSFCEMYSAKKFRIKSHQDVFKEIDFLAHNYPDTRKIFLADGNAMVLSYTKLLEILRKLNSVFPKLNRISMYALPSDLLSKTKEELEELNGLKLKLLYVGIESGDNDVLSLINKSENYDSTLKGLLLAQSANIKLSVMIVNGLGGRKYSRQHALNSAKLVNELQPVYLSTLVLSFPFGLDHFKNRLNEDFESLSVEELLIELRYFLANTNLENSIYRSDHASNYLVLKGVLSKDKNTLLERIDEVLNNPSALQLRQEYERGL